MHHYIGKALRIDHACKPKLYTQIYESAEITSASYILDLALVRNHRGRRRWGGVSVCSS